MVVGRNDPCPCGSGKKYKKCCMVKDQAAHVKQIKVERFFQLKNQLVDALTNRFFSSYTREELLNFKQEFDQRVKMEVHEAFFQHWLIFFHRDQNGLRGIERFNKEVNHPTPTMKEIAENWERQVPRLFQQVDEFDDGVIVEDLFSKEKLHMPYCETMPKSNPGKGGFCIIEPFDGDYYMNGVAMIVAPEQVNQAYRYIENIIEETKQPYEIVAQEYYPEILQALLTKPSSPELEPEVTAEDAILMEEIGIPLEEAPQFYVKDILDCFKERGAGKSQSTYYKYRLGLQTIGFFLSRRIHSSWFDVTTDDWEKWLSYHYLVFNSDATINQIKGFNSVLKGFVTKIDETYGTEHLPIVQKLLKELEPSIIEAAKAMDAFASYQERKNDEMYGLDYLWDLFRFTANHQ